MKVKSVVAAILATNALTAAAFNRYIHQTKESLGVLEIGGEEREIKTPGYLAERNQVLTVANEESGTQVTYLLAGIGSTAEESFSSFVPYLSGVVKYVDFDPLRYDPAAVATLILDDVQCCGYTEVRMIANSLAGRVIAEMQYRAEPRRIKSYVIDPVFNEFLKPPVRAIATAATVLLRVGNLAGGWLRYAPLPTALGWNWRTTQLLADQLATLTIRNDAPEPWWAMYLDGVVISENDWFSDHETYIGHKLEFYHIPYEVVHSDYCSTKNHWEVYVEALRKLGALDWDVIAPPEWHGQRDGEFL